METVVWLWLYDRRWFFGIKAPSLLKIWTLPLFNNAFFFVSLFYYFLRHNNDNAQCFQDFESWIYMRLLMLTLIMAGIIQVYRETSKNTALDYSEMQTYKTINPILVKNYNYWITRKVLISFPGLSLLALGLINWFWIARGMNIVYNQYYIIYGCGAFMKNVVWGNLILTAILSLPVLWVFFSMILIKGTCIILGVISPSALIKLKKKTASW
jgi:hypothetical protein